jgi:hypothetical protein
VGEVGERLDATGKVSIDSQTESWSATSEGTSLTAIQADHSSPQPQPILALWLAAPAFNEIANANRGPVTKSLPGVHAEGTRQEARIVP